MKTAKLWLQFPDTDPLSLIATFSDGDVKLLEDFAYHVKELKGTKIISGKYPFRFNFKWDGEGTHVETNEIDDEYLSSFLHKLRPLILEDEKSSFEKILQLLVRRFSNLGMNRQAKAFRRHYKKSTFSDYGQITIADVPVFNDKTLWDWLNAYEYHRDSDKKDRIKYIESSFASGTRSVFIWQLRDKADVISN